MSRTVLVALVAAGALATAAPVAIADLQIGGSTVAADTAATAYPSQPGVTYHGTLNSDTATYHDLDCCASTVSRRATAAPIGLK